ncbi:MAG: PIN domain nuclease [Burkholderiaceae bacterium]|nr:PIN domain nuclease [Burkholderiaceae bacterium]
MRAVRTHRPDDVWTTYASVWIDYFRGIVTPPTDRLDALLGSELLATGDLTLTEVLQGFDDIRDFDRTRRLLDAFEIVVISDREVAIRTAKNFRALRRLGITPRKTIDTLIATRCIADGYALLYSDRDFDPFVAHLGLRSAMAGG